MSPLADNAILLLCRDIKSIKHSNSGFSIRVVFKSCRAVKIESLFKLIHSFENSNCLCISICCCIQATNTDTVYAFV